MNAIDLIGAVGAAALRQRLETPVEGDGIARFMLNRLTSAQVTAIVQALLKDTGTAAAIKFAIPRTAGAAALPDSVLTDLRPVAVRNAPIESPFKALLLANMDDDQETSLQEVALIGVEELTDEPKLWVDAAAVDLGLSDQTVQMWKAALKGFADAHHWTLQQFANYVADTRAQIAQESQPVTVALGWALPALQIPRDSTYFLTLSGGETAPATRWRQFYRKLVADRKPLLVRQRSSRQIIDAGELHTQLEQIKPDLTPAVIAAMEAFIAAPPSWGSPAAALAQYEWAKDNVLQLFSGVKRPKSGLSEETVHHFEYEVDDPLSEKERDYLKQLKEAKPKEPREEDVAFFDDRRDDLGKNRTLRAKWEKFIFGRPIEVDDFLEGLLLVLERLNGQTAAKGVARTLEIRAPKWAKGRWLDLNADVATAFCLRYRGLPHLMGPQVTWIGTEILFDYDNFLIRTEQKKPKKYKKNVSTARASRQIKFDVTLTVGNGALAEKASAQLVWRGDTAAIGLELRDDLDRLLKQPFVRSEVARQSVSRKGSLQSIALTDVTTLQPAYRQDSGSLVPRLDASIHVGKGLGAELKAAASDGRVAPTGIAAIEAAWATFSDCYRAALEAWRTTGAADPALLDQAKAYGELLETLRTYANSDLNRVKLWEPILALGCVAVTGGAPAAIIAPWHPLRLASIAIKSRAIAGLAQHILTADEVNFGDARLFFTDICAELQHPFYPEIAVGYEGTEPKLLTETVTINDYSLMERPIRTSTQATTDVDPTRAARQIKDLLGRYLDLQPHEKSNLSIMLFNCDAARLPLATINELGSVHEEDEMHCNVLVRHRDRAKLGQVYTELLERAESDPDALVVSETSRNFMSKLRIGVMLEAGPAVSGGERSVDVAFLHDVVSRQAREAWFPVPATGHAPDLLDHVPARWSYRRVTAEDELKATTYLACPRQPAAGWAYLNAVAAVIQRQAHDPSVHMLPARQISFQDQGLKSMFDEVHGLADWVATYDDLLDKRQLAAQNIKVIRYRRQTTHGRNMIVSSTSELRILNVLVRRRLAELGLSLPEARAAALAQRMIDLACRISGDIALRAAKRGVSAGELIGLVLSQALVAEELGGEASVAWFLLDDYASWLGQREERIADLLALSFGEAPDGSKRLRVVVTEAKYVSDTNAAAAKQSSRQQLRETVQRIGDALFGDPGRLDRDLWLSRLSDLLLDGTTAIGQSSVLEAVRDGIRRGEVQIDLRGYSHVFVSNSLDDDTSPGEQSSVADVPHGLQESFFREGVRALVMAFEANSSLIPVRQKLGDERSWEAITYQSPAPRVSWTARPSASAAPAKPKTPLVQLDEADALVPEASSDATPMEGEPAPTASTAPPDATTSADVGDPSENLETAPLEGGIKALIERHALQHAATSESEEAWLASTAQKLRSALLSYNFQAKITGTRLTPNAALIRFAGSDRLRVEDLEAKQSALLTTHGLRLISVAPLPGEIVAAVARPQRETVSLWDVWRRREFNRNDAGVNTAFVLGLRELDGEVLYLNLGAQFGATPQHEPHTLVAGATGSGKSVLIQSLILDIAATNSSTLVHIHLIDPKMGVDYASLERLPHVKGGIVIDQDKATAVLEELVLEMDRRYELFRTRGSKNLTTFNTKSPPNERLPTLFLIHDEFAEWMLTDEYKEAVTSKVARLGVKARAAGIHLIFAAQRPDANVMPMQLRDNLGNRLILKVSSVGTSEIALGMKGAESLLGQGHLAARLSGEPGVVFAQAPYLSDDEIDLAVDAIIAGESGHVKA